MSPYPPAPARLRAAGRALLRPVAALVSALVVLLVLPARPASAAATWTWPLEGPHPVSRPFAPGPTPYSPGHRGVDLPAAPGAVVRAAGAGRVSYAGLLAGRGVVVVVHGALRTTYEPVDAAVPVGAVVAGGAPLGTLAAGHAGCPVAACLHWGLLRGNDYLDPVRLVAPPGVRLLPRTAGAGSGPTAASGPTVAAGADAAGPDAAGPDAAGPDAAGPGPVAPPPGTVGAAGPEQGPPAGVRARASAGPGPRGGGGAAPPAAVGAGLVLAGAGLLRRRP